jgi:hypothetical protein
MAVKRRAEGDRIRLALALLAAVLALLALQAPMAGDGNPPAMGAHGDVAISAGGG